ncbi:MAG: hypothetical protein QMD71_03430 [bacterium]|nr:hypothetical protein [bacterium]
MDYKNILNKLIVEMRVFLAVCVVILLGMIFFVGFLDGLIRGGMFSIFIIWCVVTLSWLIFIYGKR